MPIEAPRTSELPRSYDPAYVETEAAAVWKAKRCFMLILPLPASRIALSFRRRM